MRINTFTQSSDTHQVFMTKLSVDAYCVAYVTLEEPVPRCAAESCFFIDSVLEVVQNWIERSQKCLSFVYTIPIRFHLLMT